MRFIKYMINPIFVAYFKSIFKFGTYYTGRYSKWEEAKLNSNGYDSEIILSRVINARKKILAGKAIYERDSVLFDEITYAFETISALLNISLLNKSSLCVLDYGGSLGSSYFQCAQFLKSINNISWCIVEQPGLVEAGKKIFQNNQPYFFYNINECCELYHPNVALFSSTLQYLSNPLEVLDLVSQKQIEWIIIDRVQVCMEESAFYTVQHVSPKIYEGSYPIKIFGKNTLEKYLAKKSYDLFVSYDSNWDGSHPEFVSGTLFRSKGYIFRLKNLLENAIE
jgi:putative methyltransferase (TIGR04325 family)